MAKKRNTRAVTKDAIGKEIKAVLLVGAGMVAGSMGGKVIDKALKVDPTDTRLSLKKLIRPLALISAGTIGHLKLANENFKQLAKGVALSGLMTGIKVVLRKDLLNGLDGVDGLEGGSVLGQFADTQVYYEPDMREYRAAYALPMAGNIEAYDPILPELDALPINGESDDFLRSQGIADAGEIGEVVEAEIIL